LQGTQQQEEAFSSVSYSSYFFRYLNLTFPLGLEQGSKKNATQIKNIWEK